MGEHTVIENILQDEKNSNLSSAVHTANVVFNSEQLNYINSAEIRYLLNSVKTKT
jgi:hypothetical protein